MSKYHCLPFLLWRISGALCFDAFLVEGGAWMMVAAIMVPPLRSNPFLSEVSLMAFMIAAANWCFSIRRMNFRSGLIRHEFIKKALPGEGSHARHIAKSPFHVGIIGGEPLLHKVNA